MNKKILIGSIFAVALLVLVSFSSVVGKTSVDTEPVEFEVEYCGLGKKHTVSLTKQDADEVELLFDEIEHRVSKVETREQAEVIFNDAVVELDKYGLLGGLNVKKVQRFVTASTQSQHIMGLFESRLGLLQKSYIEDDNFNCLIIGKTSNSFFYPLWSIFIEPHTIDLNELLDRISEKPIKSLLFLTIFILYHGIYVISPLNTAGYITIGQMNAQPHGSTKWYPSTLWISTFGKNGKKNWSGDYYGQIKTFEFYDYSGGIQRNFAGISGFIGLHLHLKKSDEDFFLGSCYRVSLGGKPDN